MHVELAAVVLGEGGKRPLVTSADGGQDRRIFSLRR